MKIICPKCDGNGYFWVPNYSDWIVHDEYIRWECNNCQGTGEVDEPEGDDENE